jgi:hypothetical protein
VLPPPLLPALPLPELPLPELPLLALLLPELLEPASLDDVDGVEVEDELSLLDVEAAGVVDGVDELSELPGLLDE